MFVICVSQLLQLCRKTVTVNADEFYHVDMLEVLLSQA